MIPYKDLQKRGKFPLCTFVLILANLALFSYELSLSSTALPSWMERHGFTPGRFEPLDAVTGLFIHGSWLHLVANMLYLWVFGRKVENRLGFRNFFWFYFASGLVATVSQTMIDRGSLIPQIGASGAVAGILGYYLRLAPRSLIGVIVPIFIFFKRIILPAWLVLFIWFLVQLLQGFSSLTTTAGGGTAFFAHIGGFLFGLLAGPLFDPLKTGQKRK